MNVVWDHWIVGETWLFTVSCLLVTTGTALCLFGLIVFHRVSQAIDTINEVLATIQERTESELSQNPPPPCA